MKTELTFHGQQNGFFNCGPQPHIYFGGVGCGKTWIACLKMMYLLHEYPGSRGVIIRKEGNALKKTTLATLKQILPVNRIKSQNLNEGVINLECGSRIDLLHLGNANSLDNLKSLEINFAYIDQMEEITDPVAWDTVLERLGRWTGATKLGGFPADWPHKTEAGLFVPPPYAFASCYSPGYEHWITARFWEQGDSRERYRKQGYITYFGSTLENPNLTKRYKEERLARGEEYVNRYVKAINWGANEGRIFEIDPQSILEPEPALLERIRRRMRLHRVLDPADFDTTACGWYATDEHGNVFFYREYGRDNLLVSQHRRNIFEMSKPDGFNTVPSYYSNIADPSIRNKTRGRTATQSPQWSVQDEWADSRVTEPETAVYWRAANNDESMTISRVREYLRVDPTHTNPVTGQKGAPRLYFIQSNAAYPEGCREILTDVRAAKRVEVGENPDGTKRFGDKRDENTRDHYLDIVRYAIGNRPSLGEAKSAEPPPPGEIRWKDYEEAIEEAELDQEIQDKISFTGHGEMGEY
jgi:hypothetical protein